MTLEQKKMASHPVSGSFSMSDSSRGIPDEHSNADHKIIDVAPEVTAGQKKDDSRTCCILSIAVGVILLVVAIIAIYYIVSQRNADSQDTSNGGTTKPRKVALIISLAHPSLKLGDGKLPGSINDGFRYTALLKSKGYEVTWLRDFKLPKGIKTEAELFKAQTPKNNYLLEQLDSSDPAYASAKKMTDTIKHMVKTLRPGDAFWFSHSGHGGQIPDFDGDEADKQDEMITTADYGRKKPTPFDPNNLGATSDIYITDDWLREQVLQLKCESFFFIESCHSASMLDLDYEYKSGAMVHVPKRPGSKVNNRSRCVLLTPCRDSQTGLQVEKSDGVMPGLRVGDKPYGLYLGGLLNLAMRLVLKEKPNIAIGDLLKECRQYLLKRVSTLPALAKQGVDMKNHTPCLSASYPLDLNTPFEELCDGILAK